MSDYNQLDKRELDRYITKSDEDLIMDNDIESKGSLRVWWIPQVPGKRFFVYVDDLEQAKLVMNVLADYDQFQFQNHIKPDYTNAGGVEMWDDDDGSGEPGWCDWYSEDGDSFEEWMEVQDGE